jgi:N,N'-diacetyllegionaminate synthase
VPIYAILLGCSFIEKHFCLDRKNAKYDGFSSLDFKELSSLILNIKDACNASSGSFIKNAEIQYLKESIQIPTLNHDMIEGDLLSDTDLVYRRTSQYGIRIKEIFDLQKKKRVLKKIKSKYSSVVATDYRKAKIAIIVAGRMKSKRLLQKATLSLYGISSIERCLIQCLAIKNVDQVILATSNLNEDYILKNYTLNDTVSFVQGDPEDVINRYLFACDIHKVDIVVRITADCPLIIPEIIEHLIEQHFNSGADYTAAKDFAVGTSGEIINTNALKKVIKYFGRAKHSEYMTWYFKNNPKYFKINMVDLPPNLVRNYRMTLDYPEDLQMFEKLFEILGGGNRAYSAKEVFNSLDANPNIYNTNINLTLRYRTDQILINLLNKDTKISEKKRP